MIFFEQLTLAHLLEFLAAVAGSYYLIRTKDESFVKYFVWFLWLTSFVEIVATYAGVAYYSNYEIFSFVKDTPFRGNYWLYNIYSIIAFTVYINFFVLLSRNRKWRKIMFVLTGLYIISAITNLFLTDVYFKSHSIFTFFSGTILVLMSIGIYYFELFSSNEILEIRKSIAFYISIGALVYHLGFVPLVIYSGYFSSESPEFVKLYVSILYGINYFLYFIYILGFIICSKKKNSF